MAQSEPNDPSGKAAPGDVDELQSPPEAADPITALLSEIALAEPLGDTRDVSTPGPTTSANLPIAASGKNPEGGDSTHIKPTRRPGGNPGSLGAAGQGRADATSTAVTPASQPTGEMIGLVITVPLPPPSAVALPTKVTGSGDLADLHRSVSVDPEIAQHASGAHAAVPASSPVLSPAAAEPDKIAVKATVAPETAAPGLRAEMLQTTAPETVASPVAPAGQVRHPAPADQIAPTLVGILQRPDGQQSVTIRLQPDELGQVQIRIDQTGAGAAHIQIIAERPETLQLLQRDEPRLQQVLDQSGMLSTGRTVSFQALPPEQIGAAASRPESMETSTGTSGQGQSGGAWRQNGDSPDDFGRSADPDQEQNRPRWFRAGLDITA